MIGRYKVITLCGSTRFKDTFEKVAKDLTLEGAIILAPTVFGHSGDGGLLTDETKKMLDNMHLRKIDMCDEVFVVNVGGYIGESTRKEIQYALRNGRAVRYLESEDE